jgi:hypothetical protein
MISRTAQRASSEKLIFNEVLLPRKSEYDAITISGRIQAMYV